MIKQWQISEVISNQACIISAMGESNSPLVIPILLKVIENRDSDDLLVQFAFEACGKLKVLRAVPLILKRMSYERRKQNDQEVLSMEEFGEEEIFNQILHEGYVALGEIASKFPNVLQYLLPE